MFMKGRFSILKSKLMNLSLSVVVSLGLATSSIQCAFAAAQTKGAQTTMNTQLATKTEDKYVFKILKKNKLVTKSLFTKVVKKTKFLNMVLWLFDYDDAEDTTKRAEKRGLTTGLDSYKKGHTDVTIGDAINLALRAAGVSKDDMLAEAYFSILQADGVIPKNKKIDSKFNYKLALDILEAIRKERTNCFKSINYPQVPVDQLINTQKSKTNVQISPDEAYEAYLDEWSGVYNAFVRSKANGKITRVSSVTTSDISGIQWAGNRLLYFKDNGGDECYHIYSSSFSGYKEKDLTKRAGKSFQYAGYLEQNGVFYLYVKIYDKSLREFVYYKINVAEDIWEKINLEGGYWQSAIFNIPNDNNHYLRISQEFNNGENAKVYRIDKKTRAEEVIFEASNGKQFIPEFMDESGTILYGLSNQKTPMLCPVELDIENGALNVLYKDPEKYDVLTSVGNTRPISMLGGTLIVQYYAQKFKSSAIDAGVQNTLQEIKSKLKCEELLVKNISNDLNVFTVQEVTPLLNGNEYTYNKNTKTLICTQNRGNLSEIEKTLDVYARPISFLSRDKNKIEGYLTLPTGKAPESLPTVVLVHGGPWVRDEWRCSGEAQLWKNRGYAVLQINYRGSTGYGRKFLELGDRQWGKKIQNDITDGTKWLIKKGVADPDRICIAGGSYGGFSALWGLAFEPDLYACGVSLCGFSDVSSFLNNMPDSWQSYLKQLYVHVGDPVNDRSKLKEVSPVSKLEDIKKPLFIGQGANDSRVKRVESDRVVNALRANGQTVTYIVRENEGHGFHKKQNILDFYNRVDKFLKKYLKPDKITTTKF